MDSRAKTAMLAMVSSALVAAWLGVTEQPEEVMLVPDSARVAVATERTSPWSVGDSVVDHSRQAAKLYPVPLAPELQHYTISVAQQHGVDPALVLATMGQESQYDAGLVSDTRDWGLMQINEINHPRLERELGITDWLEPRQNILAGVVMLAELQQRYQDEHQILMAYNMGETGAGRAWARGISSTRYSRAITHAAEHLREVMQDGDDEDDQVSTVWTSATAPAEH